MSQAPPHAGDDGAPPPSPIPGDLPYERLVERMVRVDHAGEFGAARIYQGQLAVLGVGPKGATLRHMLAQEMEHKAFFEREISNRQIRPTALQPVWNVAGWLLGAGSALLGDKAAMACTVAIEETIDAHYLKQIEQLGDNDHELRAAIVKFREEELEHRDIGYLHGAEQAPAYFLLSKVIRKGARLAIWLSERV